MLDYEAKSIQIHQSKAKETKLGVFEGRIHVGRIFQSQITAMQKEDSDAGEAVTEQEFINAVLYAVQESSRLQGPWEIHFG